MVSTLPSRPGLYIIFGLFSEEEQLRWLGRSLFEYPEPPNITNLSSNGTYSGSSVFKTCGAEKLRWTTLGLDYDWTSKDYSMEEKALPIEIKQISKLVIDVLGLFPLVPDAAIVNYYPKNASISPHADTSEIDLRRPLVSFSFGQSAVFLIGGQTPDLPVDALLLRSGDVLVMADFQRIAFHAVPRILSGETTFSDGKWGKEAEEVVEYANKCRVNITVRQVKNLGESGDESD
ncbi:hypothetical protein niasHT_003857 [Heterodera trifolii]|uniref:Fe2OG dioxygenase domain-containing protein n=1 Tax=Heterodera trifolii TaxID=157864 RepID=A0ABD2LV57_9BILA